MWKNSTFYNKTNTLFYEHFGTKNKFNRVIEKTKRYKASRGSSHKREKASHRLMSVEEELMEVDGYGYQESVTGSTVSETESE